MTHAAIVVPLDLADKTQGVLDTALDLAKRFDARLALLNVVPLPPGIDPTLAVHPEIHPDGDDVMGQLESEAAEGLKPHVARCDEAGVPAEGFVRRGHVVDAVLGLAEEVDAALIVVGTAGRQGLTRMLLGSVAEQVVRRAKVPVVTVRDTD